MSFFTVRSTFCFLSNSATDPTCRSRSRSQAHRAQPRLRKLRQLPSPPDIRRDPLLQRLHALGHVRPRPQLLAHDAPARRTIPRDPPTPDPDLRPRHQPSETRRRHRQGQRRHPNLQHHHHRRQDRRRPLLQRNVPLPPRLGRLRWAEEGNGSRRRYRCQQAASA